jgi:hypothetical protein
LKSYNDSDRQVEPGDVSDSVNDGADTTDTETSQIVEASELLPIQQVRDMAELKATLRAMRLVDGSKKKKLAELKAAREEAARRFEFTKAHTGPSANDWVSFARANAEWCQAHLAVCGNYPPADEIDAKAMLWIGKFQK